MLKLLSLTLISFLSAAQSPTTAPEGGALLPTNPNVWSTIATDGAPAARGEPAFAWTGSRLLVWGGRGAGGYLSDGAIYDPGVNAWSVMTTSNAPSARAYTFSAWTGGHFVVWGGAAGGGSTLSRTFNDGAVYDPQTNTWTAMPSNAAPSARMTDFNTAIWTGSRVIIWGGYDPTKNAYDSGGSLYDPLANSWTTMSLIGAPAGRTGHIAAWTGSKMIVWGGVYFSNGVANYRGDGAIYDPVGNSWTPMNATGAPGARYGASSVWTGSRLIVWGGYNGGDFNDGYAYDPATDTWSPISTVNAPSGRNMAATAWTGSRMIVWSGYQGNSAGSRADGAQYDPVANVWIPLSTSSAPAGAGQAATVWTGDMMLTWSGFNGSGYVSGGGVYR